MAEYNPSKIIKDGNTYNFRDTTKIPLAGSNQISGDLIPSTDGTVNLGSSSNRYNSVYTFQVASNNYARLDMCGGLSRNNGGSLSVHGKDLPDSNFAGTFLLRAADGSVYADLMGTPSGTLTWNGKNVDCVEEQTNAPNGYIRYTNGIQICWGAFINNNNIEPGKSSYTFPKAFNAEPRIIVTTNLLDLYFVTATANATTFSVGFIQCFSSPAGLSANPVVFDYIAIGTWK